MACEGPLIVNSEALVRAAVMQGAGAAILAEQDVEDDLRSGRLIRCWKRGARRCSATLSITQAVVSRPLACGRSSAS